jgi:hypothetical protein
MSLLRTHHCKVRGALYGSCHLNDVLGLHTSFLRFSLATNPLFYGLVDITVNAGSASIEAKECFMPELYM